MRHLVLTTILALAAAGSAQAAEPAQTAFDLLSEYASIEKTSDYVKLRSSLDADKAMTLDARFSELYGEPAVNRAGLKVWEVANPAPGPGQADFTTIMCGPDEDGGVYISADRRGLNARQPLSETVEKPTISSSASVSLSLPTISSFSVLPYTPQGD